MTPQDSTNQELVSAYLKKGGIIHRYLPGTSGMNLPTDIKEKHKKIMTFIYRSNRAKKLSNELKKYTYDCRADGRSAPLGHLKLFNEVDLELANSLFAKRTEGYD